MPNYNYDIEEVFDAIAEKIITSGLIKTTDALLTNQKTIKNGLIKRGRANGEKLILYEKDRKANADDLLLLGIASTDVDGSYIEAGLTLEQILERFDSMPEIIVLDNGTDGVQILLEGYITLTGENAGQYTDTIDISSILSDTEDNPLNISQFTHILQSETTVDPEQANEFLDTTIFELLPGAASRQERINLFFAEYNILKGNVPTFDADTDGVIDPDFDAHAYSLGHDISTAQDDTGATISEQESFITRLDFHENDNNEDKTLQWLRDDLNLFLKDIDEEGVSPEDERPEYENKSDGYLKFRNLNQGIIIRNTESKYIEGLNPETQEYLSTGFTITMWVRFLDKVSQGTLFNFGNPTRESYPLGFKLETHVENEERYVRLLVYDSDDEIYYDSHTGIPGDPKNDTNLISDLDDINTNQWTKIPMDFSEWYFICANYNIDVDEANSDHNIDDPHFWLNHIENSDGSGDYTTYSGFGNRAKVEFISRSDLLRARGYKV